MLGSTVTFSKAVVPRLSTVLLPVVQPPLGRSFSLTSADLGNHLNERLEKLKMVDLQIRNKRGTKRFKREQMGKTNPKYPDVPIYRYGVKTPVIKHFGKIEQVPEMVPELIVPDLTDCQLKPYVSYATKEITQEEITSKDLFSEIYARKIVDDFKEGKLTSDGKPLEPSPAERLQPEEAFIRARKTGSDIFQGGDPPNKVWKLDIPVGKA